MRRVVLAALCITGLMGCYSEDDFATDMMDASCAKTQECESNIISYYEDNGFDTETATASYETLEAAYCATATEGEGEGEGEESTCSFDKAAAKTCIDDINAATCSDSATGWDWPSSCNSVCG